MKQFKTIFSHEYTSLLKNKPFIITTILFSVVIAIMVAIPGIISLVGTIKDTIESNKTEEVVDNSSKEILLISADTTFAPIVQNLFTNVFTDYAIVITDDSVESIKETITSKEANCAFVFENETSFTYYVGTKKMMDSNADIASEVLRNAFRIQNFQELGLTVEESQAKAFPLITANTETLTVDQSENFIVAYIMIFGLYMMVLLYGSLISTSVATEKSSRAMELLITSANTSDLMFGKVFATCAAALTQVVCIILSGVLVFLFTKNSWGLNPAMASMFSVSFETVIYFVVFFILGFLLYAFMFAAMASTASKLEDTNTSLMPVILIFIVCFILTIQNMFTGADGMLFKVLSYIPFSSSMAMFARVALTDVPFWEPLLSVGILFITIFFIGTLSAKIYRMGVLLYGSQPKLKDIFKALRKN